MSSLLNIVQGIGESQPGKPEILFARVTKVNPIEIEVIGDEKVRPSGDIVIIPKSLTDYEVQGSIESDASTASVELDNQGSPGGWDTYDLRNLQVGVTFFVKNALKVGEKVICVTSEMGQRFTILDRISEV